MNPIDSHHPASERIPSSFKDASAYNIQFKDGKPILIDTLSFEKYQEGRPWIAYRQFCQHFLAPLALMALTDVRLNQLARIYIDGIPLDLASRLLPMKSWLKFSLLSHIHLHAKSQKHFADKQINVKNRKVSRFSLLGIIDNLNKATEKLDWQPFGTEWADYYDATNYSTEASEHKKAIISEYLERIGPKTVWDFGANTGVFSRLASDKRIPTVSFDVDPSAVEFDLLFHWGLVRPRPHTTTRDNGKRAKSVQRCIRLSSSGASGYVSVSFQRQKQRYRGGKHTCPVK